MCLGLLLSQVSALIARSVNEKKKCKRDKKTTNGCKLSSLSRFAVTQPSTFFPPLTGPLHVLLVSLMLGELIHRTTVSLFPSTKDFMLTFPEWGRQVTRALRIFCLFNGAARWLSSQNDS